MPKESHPSEPVSTRVTARQKQVVDEAAQLLKMSTAKFIREAVIEKAVAVLNASGNNNDPLRELAEKLLIPALNPMVEVVWQPQFDEMGEHVDKFRAVDWENMDPIEFQVYMDQMHDGPYGQHTVRVVRPDDIDPSPLSWCPLSSSFFCFGLCLN